MVDFLVDNWQLIVSVSLAVLTLIAQFAKRKVKGSNWFDLLCNCLLHVPSLVSEAETMNVSGEDKKKYVIKRVFMLFSEIVDLNSLSPNQIKCCENYISKQIELVLDSPQKKKEVKQ